MMAGRLNKKIVIEHNAATGGNILGEEERSSMVNYPTRAEVVWGSGRRVADLEVSYDYDVTFIVWIYMYDRIKEGDTVVYASKKYTITSLEPVPETRMLYIRAQSI